MLSLFPIGQGDRLPSITDTITDSAGAAVDLTGASVVFRWHLKDGSRPALTGAATVVNAATGQVRYDWAAGDTDVPGVYRAQWVVTFGGGKQETFPSTGYTTVTINRSA